MRRIGAGLALLLFGGAVLVVEARAREARAEFSLRDIFLDGETGRTKLERCVQRCERNYPTPAGGTPTPTPTPSPTRTTARRAPTSST